MLAWVNQGMLSLKEIGRIASGKRVIWTMHDMWNLTSLCHHAGQCRRYTEPRGCHRCPLLHTRSSDNDASSRVWRNKQRLYGTADIDFVAASNWLGNRCRESRLMDSSRVSVIPNAFPVEEFYSAPTNDGTRVVLMGAARLDDPVKGLPLAVEMLNKLKNSDNTLVRFFGALRDPHALDGLRIKYEYLGPIHDAAKVRELYSGAHAVISTSLYETLPGTLIEGRGLGGYAGELRPWRTVGYNKEQRRRPPYTIWRYRWHGNSPRRSTCHRSRPQRIAPHRSRTILGIGSRKKYIELID